jgi:nucleoid DNA-binding protein
VGGPKSVQSGPTIGREELYDAVQRAAGVSAAEPKLLVSQVLEEIASTLTCGETVKLSAFRLFVVHHKKARLGHNPKTSARVPRAAVQAISGIEERH